MIGLGKLYDKGQLFYPVEFFVVQPVLDQHKKSDGFLRAHFSSFHLSRHIENA
jgi:hypothetical protein